MLKKNSNKKNSAADDLLSSLLEDVDQFDANADEKMELEPTVYGTPKKGDKNKSDKKDEVEVSSEYLMPGFEAEKSVASIGLSQSSVDSVSPDDFWEQAEKMAGKSVNHNDLSQSDDYRNLDKNQKPPKYQGPEASSDFLDQVNAHLSPIHKSGVVNTGSDSNSNKSSYNSKLESGYEESVPGIHQPTEVLNPDKTVPLTAMQGLELPQIMNQNGDAERTVAVTQFANKQNKLKIQSEIPELPKNFPSDSSDSDNGHDERIMLVTQQKISKSNSSQVSIDASLAQAENLRMAQNRILDLEKEIERLRQENDEILTASEILRTKAEEYTIRISELEKEAQESRTDSKNEIAILKGNLAYKENDNQKLKLKVEELDIRIKTDFKKIRIRERELENRLELIKAEKQAVAKSKDDLLLDLQRKNDQAKSEIDNYREKVQELNKSLENNQNQIKMTVRALRIALSHIEDKSENSTPIKKAN